MNKFYCISFTLVAWLVSVNAVPTIDPVTQGTTTKPPVIADPPWTRTPALNGLIGWMIGARTFAHVVQPKTIGQFIDYFKIQSWNDPNTWNTELLKRWQEWLPYIIGYIIIGVFSFLFFVITPITGSFWACCRCGGKCGARAHLKRNTSRCKRRGCAITLFILSGLMITTYVMASLSLRSAATDLSRNGLLNDTINGIDNMNSFTTSSLKELRNLVFTELNKIKDGSIQLLENTPTAARDELMNKTGIEQPFTNMVEFAKLMPSVRGNFDKMTTGKTNLTNERAALATELTNRRTEIRKLLTTDKCVGDATCISLNKTLNDLVPLADYNQLADVTAEHTAIDTAIRNGLLIDVDAAEQAYNGIMLSINQSVASNLNEVRAKIEEMMTRVQREYNNIENQFNNVSLAEGRKRLITVREKVYEWTNRLHPAAQGFLFIICISSFLYIIGLLSALCSRLPQTGDGACGPTTRHTARLLMAGTGFAFIFSWVFLIVALSTFLAGAGVTNNACRHIINVHVNPPKLQFDYTMDRVWTVTRNDLQRNNIVNLNFTSLSAIITSLENNEALYTALQMERNGFNVTDLLDLRKYGVYDLLDRLKTLNISIGTPILLTPEMNTTIGGLYGRLSAINFTTYDAVLTKAVTKTSVKAFADQLAATANRLGYEALQNETNALRSGAEATVNRMTIVRNDVYNAANNSRDAIKRHDMGIALQQLSNGQTVLHQQGKQVLKGVISRVSDELKSLMQGGMNVVDQAIRTTTARSRPLYDTLNKLGRSVCVYCINSLNGFWFSVGAYLFLLIPAMIISVSLAGYYREVQDEPDDYVQPPPQYDVPKANYPYAISRSEKNPAHLAPPSFYSQPSGTKL